MNYNTDTIDKKLAKPACLTRTARTRSAVLPPPRRRAPRMRSPPRRTTSGGTQRRAPSEAGRCPAMHRWSPHVHRRRTAPRRWRPRLRYQNRSRRYFLTIDLTPVHVFHCVFGLVRSLKFYVCISEKCARVKHEVRSST